MSRIRKSKISLSILLMTILSVVLLGIYVYLPRNTMAQATQTVVLKAGTPVNLRLTEEISSKNKNVGDVVHFEVAGDVRVDNKIVIKSGSIAEGEITVLDQRGIIGKPEKLAFIVRLVNAVDGTKVPLRATLTREGEDKETSKLMLGIFLCPIFLFQKGGTAEFPVGTEIRAYVDYDTKIEIASSIQ